MQKQLPKTFTLQTNYNNKYLSYIIDKDLNELRLISKDEYLPPDSNSEFETEASSVDDGLFVSIKSSYNNKYLAVMKSKSENDDDDDQHLVSPIADTPNEDQSSESCTLFKPHFVGENDNNNSQVRFYHAYYKNYLSFSVTKPGLFLPSFDQDHDQIFFEWFTFTDIEPPSSDHDVYAFEGDNKKFLSIYMGEEYENENGNGNKENFPYLKFFAENTQSPDVWFKCHLPRPGVDNANKLFEIKSITKNGYWLCASSKWIVANGTAQIENLNQFKFDREKSAFMVNGNYCQRNIADDDDQKMDCYIANTPVFTNQSKIRLVPKKHIEDK